MRGRAVIIQQDQNLALFLKNLLTKRGYEVLLFVDPGDCRLIEGESECTKTSECADIFIIDYETSYLNSEDLIEEQIFKRCKTPPACKAIIINPFHGEIGAKAHQLGCTLLHMPIDIDRLHAWLDNCENLNSGDNFRSSIDKSKPPTCQSPRENQSLLRVAG